MRELYIGNLPESMQGSGAVLSKFIKKIGSVQCLMQQVHVSPLYIGTGVL